MKSKKKTENKKKFKLEKFEVAKLKNLHLIVGGGIGADDPIDTNKTGRGASSVDCG